MCVFCRGLRVFVGRLRTRRRAIPGVFRARKKCIKIRCQDVPMIPIGSISEDLEAHPTPSIMDRFSPWKIAWRHQRHLLEGNGLNRGYKTVKNLLEGVWALLMRITLRKRFMKVNFLDENSILLKTRQIRYFNFQAWNMLSKSLDFNIFSLEFQIFL